MESKLMEKKAVLDVIEYLMGGVHWTQESKQKAIEDWEALKKASAEAGEEVDPECYNAQQARKAEIWLNALETVKKHLEKLI